jgi:uncharacterized iron-regulated membrane protein
MPNEDWVFWLNLTNVALGVVVLLAVLLVAYGLVWEFLSRHKKPRGLRNLDEEMKAMLQNDFAHSLPVPELGLTMADGGDLAKPSPEKPEKKKKS